MGMSRRLTELANDKKTVAPSGLVLSMAGRRGKR